MTNSLCPTTLKPDEGPVLHDSRPSRTADEDNQAQVCCGSRSKVQALLAYWPQLSTKRLTLSPRNVQSAQTLSMTKVDVAGSDIEGAGKRWEQRYVVVVFNEPREGAFWRLEHERVADLFRVPGG